MSDEKDNAHESRSVIHRRLDEQMRQISLSGQGGVDQQRRRRRVARGDQSPQGNGSNKADEANVTATSDKEPAKPTTAAPKSVKVPKAIDKKYSSETPGKARHTCVDSYHAAKDAGTLGDLKWIQKGGGYWSLCITSIKAAGRARPLFPVRREAPRHATRQVSRTETGTNTP